jgi:hypothetical protein
MVGICVGVYTVLDSILVLPPVHNKAVSQCKFYTNTLTSTQLGEKFMTFLAT